MHDIINAIILGIVQGVTEFLPISSTGHLILVDEFLQSFPADFGKAFDVVIQLGSILAVVIYFWKKLWPLNSSLSPDEKNSVLDLWKKTIAGVLPAILIGGLLGSQIKEKLFNPFTVGVALFIGGILLIWIESTKREIKIATISSLTYKTAIAIGFIQCLAMIPGTSRSAATILGAMMLGASRVAAAEFSFFLAIPTMAAASAYSLLKVKSALTVDQIMALSAGFITSFLVAWLVIAVFMRFIQNNNFKLFGYYRIILGILVFGYFGFIK